MPQNEPVNQEDEFAAFSDVVDANGSPEQEDEFAAFSDPVQPQVSDTGEVIAKGAVGGAIESGTLLATTVAGAKAGAVFPPYGPFIGGAAGFIGGMFAGQELREMAAEQGVTFADIEDLPPEQRPAGVFGETTGGALTFGGGTLALAKSGFRAGKSVVGGFINQILNTAKTSPYLFMGAESTAAVSAGLAGAGAEVYDPGDAATRMMSETLGGMFNPSRVVTSTVKGVYNKIGNIYQRFTPAGRETAAAKMLNELLLERSEDPVAIARLLEAYDPKITTNVAQITGSPTLGAIQANLAKHSGKFGHESQAQADEGIKALVGMIDTLKRTGDPEALKLAAEAKFELLKVTLAGRLQDAESAAMEAAMKITKDTPAARMELSKVARKVMGDALSEARKAESELWNLVPDQPANIAAVQQKFIQLADEMLPEKQAEQLPGYVRDFLRRVRKEQGGETVTKELTKLRSHLLADSRKATQDGDFSMARVFGELAEATLDDLDSAFTGIESYDTARQFSRVLNDTFTRSFAGQAAAEGRFGARIPPELLMTKAMATGKEAAAIQMGELEEATRFLIKQGVTDDPQVLDTMMDVQERIVRLAAAESVDDLTKQVSPKKLQKFITDNEILIDRFPGVKEQLQTAVDSEVARQGIEAVRKKSTRLFETKSAFAELLKKDPIPVTQRALLSGNPERELGKLIKVARTDGDIGIAGLKTSVLDAAMKKATPAFSDKLDFEKMRNILFEAPATGKKSPIEILKAEGVFTNQDVSSMKKVFDMAKKIQTAQQPGTAIDEMDDAVDVITDLITRAVGATVATKAAAVSGTEAASRGLIIAGGGSRAARQMLEKIPNARIKEVLIDAMTNPKLMKKLLEKAPTSEKQIEKMRFLHAYFIQSGIYNVQEMLESEQPPVDMTESALSVL